MTEEVKEEKSRKFGAIIALVALAAIVAVAALAYSAMPSVQMAEPYELTPSDEVDFLASTAFAACTIMNNDDEPLTIGDITAKSHKPIVMNVWASWCTNCIDEMRDYQKLYEEYGDRVDFVMLDVNDSAGEPDSARAYAKKNGFTFPVYFDLDSSVIRELAVTAIPVSVILSADGSLLMHRVGKIEYDVMKSTIEKVLAA